MASRYFENVYSPFVSPAVGSFRMVDGGGRSAEELAAPTLKTSLTAPLPDEPAA